MIKLLGSIVSTIFLDFVSQPVTILIVVVMAALAAFALLYLVGGSILKGITFGYEKRRCRKILEDEETMIFLRKVALAGKGEASVIAQKILDKGKSLDWKKINEDRDLVRAREMCEDIEILRGLKLKV